MVEALAPPGAGPVGRTVWPWRVAGILVAAAVWAAGFTLYYNGGSALWQWGHAMDGGVDNGLRFSEVVLGLTLGALIMPLAGIPLGLGFGIRRFDEVPDLAVRLRNVTWIAAGTLVGVYIAVMALNLAALDAWQEDVLAGTRGLEAFGQYENAAVGLAMLMPFVAAVPVAQITMQKVAGAGASTAA